MRKWKEVKRERSVEHSLKVGAFRLEVSAPLGSEPASKVWECLFTVDDNEDQWICTGKPKPLEGAKAQAFREIELWLKRQQKAIDKAKS